MYRVYVSQSYEGRKSEQKIQMDTSASSHQTASNDVASRLSSAYEAKLDHVFTFNWAERQKKYDASNPLDKVTLAVIWIVLHLFFYRVFWPLLSFDGNGGCCSVTLFRKAQSAERCSLSTPYCCTSWSLWLSAKWPGPKVAFVTLPTTVPTGASITKCLLQA